MNLFEPKRHTPQMDVEDFHAACGIPIGDTIKIRRSELRARLLKEECKELRDAILTGDLVKTIDGICDVLVVTYGAACEFGINVAPFWEEVHRSNMAKQGGPVREDGKVLKPPDWRPPDLASVLERELAKQ